MGETELYADVARRALAAFIVTPAERSTRWPPSTIHLYTVDDGQPYQRSTGPQKPACWPSSIIYKDGCRTRNTHQPTKMLPRFGIAQGKCMDDSAHSDRTIVGQRYAEFLRHRDMTVFEAPYLRTTCLRSNRGGPDLNRPGDERVTGGG